MISEKQLPELRVYRRLENLLPVESAPELNRLVVPGINDQLPLHRWFRFKEGFSADLLKAVLPLLPGWERESISVLDAFCGVGTTLVSAQELSSSARITAIGIERNPFIHFVASTKIAWPRMDPKRILDIGERVLERSLYRGAKIPGLSSLSAGRCMSRHNALRLLAIRDAIRTDGNSPNHDALMLGLASVIEQLSKTRKDGRALRLVRRGRQDVGRVITKKWAQIASDVRFMRQLVPHAPIPPVFFGDGRAPGCHGIPPCSIDLLLTSPPYPNNIDYSEVYKLELWLLGFINNPNEFLNLRKTTFRSHPTAAPADPCNEFSEDLGKGMLKAVLGPIMRRTKSSREHYRHRLIVGYASDLWLTLRENHKLLKKEGICAIVVGNSLHGGKHLPYLIPTDLIVSAIAEQTGYQVKKIAIARNFRRRLSGNHFLRESVIYLEKE
jgi:hypothetical protein